MRRLLLLALVAASVAAGTARAEAPAVPPGAVAVVAGENITRARLDELLVSARRSYGARFPVRGTSAYRRIQDEAVGFLVDWAEIRQQAGPLGVEVTSAQVSDRIVEIKQLYFGGSERLYRQELTRQGLTAGQARANVRRQLLGQRIYTAVVGDGTSDVAAAAAWADWLEALQARYARLVVYAPGFSPS
ncbi:MAG: SurA N-terminal domain-containing protein [Thermoleophilia bacterium]